MRFLFLIYTVSHSRGPQPEMVIKECENLDAAKIEAVKVLEGASSRTAVEIFQSPGAGCKVAPKTIHEWT